MGLYLCEDVPAHCIIIEYLGEILTANDCQARMSEYEEQDDFYFASLGNGLMIDAKYCGSLARFANHSCEPNCELQKWNVLGENRIVLCSKFALSAGTELCYNYKYYDDGLDSNVDMKRQVCRCGSHQCCGTIGGRVIEKVNLVDQWKKKASAILSSKRKINMDSIQELRNERYSILKDQEDGLECEENDRLEELFSKSVTSLAVLQNIVSLHHTLINANSSSLKSFQGIPVLAISEVESIVSNCPSIIKIEPLSVVQSMVKAAKTAEKIHEQLLQANIEINSHNNPVRIKSEKQWWFKVIEGLQAAWDAMPIDCTTSLKYFLTCIRNASCWSTALGPYFPLGKNTAPRECFWIELLMKYYFKTNNDVDIQEVGYIFQVLQILEEKLKLFKQRHDSILCQGICTKYFCYCRMPDESCQAAVMSQCDHCQRWFHLRCINDYRTSSQLTKSTEFYCPSCCLQKNIVSNICFVDENNQWRRNDFVSVHSPRVKRNEMDDMIQETLTIDHEKKRTMDHKKKNTLKSYMTVEWLSDLMDQASKLSMWNPLIEYLQKILDIVHDWKQSVHHFLQHEQVKQLHQELQVVASCNGNGNGSSHTQSMTPQSISEASQLMDDAQELFYHLQPLQIKPAEVHQLALLIWGISVQVISYPKAVDKDESRPITSTTSITELQKAIEGGLSIGISKKSKLLGWMIQLQKKAQDWLTKCKNIGIGDDRTTLVKEYLYLSHYLHLDGVVSPSLAKFKNYQLIPDPSRYMNGLVDQFPMEVDNQPLKSLDPTLDSQDVNAIVTVKEEHKELQKEGVESTATSKTAIPLYCWCQQEDDGSPMICCDHCGHWFHYDCMGIRSKKHLALMTSKKRDDESHCKNSDAFYCIPCSSFCGVSYPFFSFS